MDNDFLTIGSLTFGKLVTSRAAREERNGRCGKGPNSMNGAAGTLAGHPRPPPRGGDARSNRVALPPLWVAAALPGAHFLTIILSYRFHLEALWVVSSFLLVALIRN